MKRRAPTNATGEIEAPPVARKLVRKTIRVNGTRVTTWVDGNCVRGGHDFGADGRCVRKGCTAAKADPRVFARLEYIAWWDRAMRDTWRAIGVEMGRKLAREAVRALMEAPKEPDFKVGKVRAAWQPLVELAMVDHKLRHPSARGDRPWIYEPAPPVKGRNDVLCRFCRRVLIVKARMGEDYTIDVAQHTVPCAATTLATGGSASPEQLKPRRK